MNSDWPFSAATTALLCDLREDGAPKTNAATLARLTIKELVLRGQIKIVSVQRRKLRRDIVRITTAPSQTPGTLPPPLDMVARRLPYSNNEDLSKVVEQLVARQPARFENDLKQAILAELRRRELIEDRKKKVLGMFTTTFPAPTPLGTEWSAAARQRRSIAEELPDLASRDAGGATATASRLGLLVLLAPAALATTAMLSARRAHERKGRRHAAVDDESWRTTLMDDDNLDVLDLCALALSGVDGVGEALDTAMDTLSGALDAIGDAVDSAIDAGISDGGGDSGDSGGGDGGGGGD